MAGGRRHRRRCRLPPRPPDATRLRVRGQLRRRRPGDADTGRTPCSAIPTATPGAAGDRRASTGLRRRATVAIAVRVRASGASEEKAREHLRPRRRRPVRPPPAGGCQLFPSPLPRRPADPSPALRIRESVARHAAADTRPRLSVRPAPRSGRGRETDGGSPTSVLSLARSADIDREQPGRHRRGRAAGNTRRLECALRMCPCRRSAGITPPGQRRPPSRSPPRRPARRVAPAMPRASLPPHSSRSQDAAADGRRRLR